MYEEGCVNSENRARGEISGRHKSRTALSNRKVQQVSALSTTNAVKKIALCKASAAV
jgi:hypothetical protein